MDLHLIAVPYDSGQRDVRMGAGPGRLLRAGLAERLAARGHRVRVAEVAADPDAFAAEVGTAFALQRGLAEVVRRAVAAGELPIVLAGNCNTAVGTVAGIDAAALDVVWLDAHGDFNTPETTVSGFLDGMALAMLVGHCWRSMTARVAGFAPVAEEAVMLVGARDLDALERERLAASRVRWVPPGVAAGDVVARLGTALGAGSDRMRSAYLHLDLDVLDPAEAVVNGYAAPDGLQHAEVEAVARLVAERRRLDAIAVTAFDPAMDADGRGGELACRFVETAVDAAARSRGG
jgi:arginase